VFRSNMIMPDSRFIGQLNVPDTLTRLILSLVATGIAPESFYALDPAGQRRPAHYDGLPVDFIAEAVTELRPREGFSTYHVSNPHDDGVGLDQFVDWLIEAGTPITRIADYDEWYRRFSTAVRGLPERQRPHSVLPLLEAYRTPQTARTGVLAPVERFRAAVQQKAIGPGDIPHLSPELIVKFVTSLAVLDLL